MHLETLIKILILSNQILYIEALKLLLFESNKNFEIEGFSVNNPDVRKSISEINPDIILLDANGMDKNVWQFLNVINKNHPDINIIMLSNSNEQIYQEYACKNGASGFVLKSSPKEILIGAIKIIMNGGSFFDPGSTKQGVLGTNFKIKEKFELSNREIEIIIFIKDGLSTKNIASQMGLSFHTIESHKKNIYKKMKVNKVTDLIRLHSEFSQ